MQTALVTGATDGIGFETARQLLARGWRVLVHGRHEARAGEAATRLATSGGTAVPVWADFGRLAEVRALADGLCERYPRVDVLINNAGVYARQRSETVDGFELTFAVNYLAHVLLTERLLPILTASPPTRVIHVGSGTHESARLDLDDLELTRDWDAYLAYSNSKLANLLYSKLLATRYPVSVLTSNALHPGVISTKLLRAGFGPGGGTPAQGASTPVLLATDPALATVTGRYFSAGRQHTPSRRAQDGAFGEALWTRTRALLGAFL